MMKMESDDSGTSSSSSIMSLDDKPKAELDVNSDCESIKSENYSYSPSGTSGTLWSSSNNEPYTQPFYEAATIPTTAERHEETAPITTFTLVPEKVVKARKKRSRVPVQSRLDKSKDSTAKPDWWTSELDVLKMVVCTKCGKMCDSILEKTLHELDCAPKALAPEKVSTRTKRKASSSGPIEKIPEEQFLYNFGEVEAGSSISFIKCEPDMAPEEDAANNGGLEDSAVLKEGKETMPANPAGDGQFVLVDKVEKPTSRQEAQAEAWLKKAFAKAMKGKAKGTRRTFAALRNSDSEPDVLPEVVPRVKCKLPHAKDFVQWGTKKIYLNHKCLRCGNTYATPSKLKRHYASHKYDKYKKFDCKHCGVSFLRQDNLNTHIKKFHKVNESIDKCNAIEPANNVLTCSHCNSTFKSRNRMSFHIRQYHCKN